APTFAAFARRAAVRAPRPLRSTRACSEPRASQRSTAARAREASHPITTHRALLSSRLLSPGPSAAPLRETRESPMRVPRLALKLQHSIVIQEARASGVRLRGVWIPPARSSRALV